MIIIKFSLFLLFLVTCSTNELKRDLAATNNEKSDLTCHFSSISNEENIYFELIRNQLDSNSSIVSNTHFFPSQDCEHIQVKENFIKERISFLNSLLSQGLAKQSWLTKLIKEFKKHRNDSFQVFKCQEEKVLDDKANTFLFINKSNGISYRYLSIGASLPLPRSERSLTSHLGLCKKK